MFACCPDFKSHRSLCLCEWCKYLEQKRLAHATHNIEHHANKSITSTSRDDVDWSIRLLKSRRIEITSKQRSPIVVLSLFLLLSNRQVIKGDIQRIHGGMNGWITRTLGIRTRENFRGSGTYRRLLSTFTCQVNWPIEYKIQDTRLNLIKISRTI